MSEQPAQSKAGCSARSMQMPDTLHIDLPHADLDDVCLIVGECLIQLTALHWDLMSVNVTSYELITWVGNLCMDIVQTLAEAILDVVMPQVYRHMKTYGTFSPTVLDLTEDRIHNYLGDSIEQALAECMQIEVQDIADTQVFSQLLRRHISKTVDSVLASTTQTPMLEFRNPVFYVSGCNTSISDLKNMAFELINILTRGHQLAGMRHELSPEVFFPGNTVMMLSQLVRTYITRNVNVLRRRAEMPYFPITSSNHRDFLLRVGRNIQMLTIEESESPIPDSQIMRTATGINKSPYLDFDKMDSIREITDNLIETFLKSSQSEEALELEDKVKLKEITDRLFSVVMMGRDYPITILPAGTRLCNTVIYRELRRGIYTNSGLVAHALYMRTEEVIYRCALQILLWSALLTPVNSDDPYTSDEDSLIYISEYCHVVEGGDNLPITSPGPSSLFSHGSYNTYEMSLREGMVLTSQGPSSNNNKPTAKKRISSFFKKCKKLCCNKTSPITPVTSQLSDKENSRLSTDEPEICQTEQRQSPVIRRIAASASSMCSSIRKKFSCFTRALRKPFSACVSPGEERRPTPTGGEETNAGRRKGDRQRLSFPPQTN